MAAKKDLSLALTKWKMFCLSNYFFDQLVAFYKNNNYYSSRPMMASESTAHSAFGLMGYSDSEPI